MARALLGNYPTILLNAHIASQGARQALEDAHDLFARVAAPLEAARCRLELARVLAVMSVDGVNVISGDTAAPSQSGYVLEPYELVARTFGVPLRDVQEAASHADPRTTMRYDLGRQSLDRHATYIVATFVAGASR